MLALTVQFQHPSVLLTHRGAWKGAKLVFLKWRIQEVSIIPSEVPYYISLPVPDPTRLQCP